MRFSWLKWPKRKVSASQKSKGVLQEIAVVGMACRFPGADNYKEYWDNLCNGVNSIREISSDRWDLSRWYSADSNATNKSISKWGGLLSRIDTFDASFFNISPQEAYTMDPQQRLILEETWHCIEDSGVRLAELQAGNTSVYVGVMATDYHQYLIDPDCETNGYSCLGNYEGILANRISYFLNLTGESQTIDAACASSLVSIHNARQSILSGQSQFAFAAGVSVICHPWKYISFSKAHMLSPDGQCKTFDASANGYVPGEGVGVILLESLENALNNGHPVYGVIRGSSVHHSGRTQSITAPRVLSQANVITDAINDAQISAETISYIEAHGSGTSLGDPIEIEGLKVAFNTDKKQFCSIGAVKPNIGHLEAAAGIAGFIKVILMLQHHKIPKLINLKTLNPVIDFENSPFRIADSLSDWDLTEAAPVRRAGISSFGFGGVGAHVILEEYIPQEQETLTPNKVQNLMVPFLLSTKSSESLKTLIASWKLYANSSEFYSESLISISAELTQKREMFSHRFGRVVKSKRDVIKVLELNEKDTDSYAPLLNKKIVIRINELLHFDVNEFLTVCTDYPILSQLQGECHEIIASMKQGKLLLKELYVSKDPTVHYAKNFIMTYVLAQSLVTSGIRPNFLIGVGPGELVEAVLSGMMDLKEVIQGILGSQSVFHLHTPSIEVHEQTHGRVFKTLDVNVMYCKRLVDHISWDHTTEQFLLTKSRQLYANQHTFIKYLEEWDDVFKMYGIKIDEGLNNKYVAKTKKKNIVLLAVYYSIKRINQKWGLTEIIPMGNDGVEELTQLLMDKVMSYEDIAALLYNKNKSTLERVATIIQKNLFKVDRSKPYLLLNQYNQRLDDITNPKSWLDERMKVPFNHVGSESDTFDDTYIIDIGNRTEQAKSGNWHLQLYELTEELPNLLVALWERGFNINWGLWYSFETRPLAASLPSYPFVKERYWYDSLHHEKNHSGVSLFHQRDIRTLNGTAYYFKEHHVNKIPTLPAAVYLDVIRRMYLQRGKAITGFKNVLWVQPIQNHQFDEQVILRMTNQIREEQFQILIEQESRTSGTVVHVEGEVLFTKPATNGLSNDIQYLISRCHEELQLNDIYEYFQHIGMDYGDNFKIIHQFFRGEGEAIARIKVNQNSSNLNEFDMDPRVIDAVFQSALLLFNDSDHLCIPFGLRQMNIFDSNMPQEGYVYVKFSSENNTKSLSKYELFLINEAGQIILHLLDFAIRSSQATVQGEDSPLYYYQPVWEPKVVEPSRVDADVLLLINEDEQFAHALKKETSDKNVCYVRSGTSFREIGNYSYEFNEKNAEHYQELLTCFDKEVKVPKVILFTLPRVDIEHMNSSLVSESLYKIFFKILYFVQALIHKKYKENILLCIVIEDDVMKENYFSLPLSALGKTIHLEIPNIHFKVIRLSNPVKQIGSVLNELNSSDVEVRFDSSGQRLVKNYQMIRPVESFESSFKKQGVYLLVGGFGGLGRIFAGILAKEFQAKLIIVGRSELNEEMYACMTQWIQDGAQIQYIRADISNTEEHVRIEHELEQTIERFGRLNGVFHAAGVLNDAFILKKNHEDYLNVLAPKLDGTLFLDELTQNEPLDFFVMFSSMVSIFGNVGQSDYAFANGFLDAWADQREQLRKLGKRHGRSLAINWPLWADGGMQVDSNYEQYFRNKLGLLSLASDEGIRAMECSLNLNTTQIAVLPGYKPLIDKALYESTQMKTHTNSIIKGRTRQDAESILKTILSQVLKLPEEKITRYEPFESYGIDSLMIMNLNQALEQVFGELPKTLFFEYLNLDSLINYFVDYHSLTLMKRSSSELSSSSEEYITSAHSEMGANPTQTEQLRSDGVLETIQNNSSAVNKIAIIGISGKYPQANDLDCFWENLEAGKDCVTEIPITRWDYHDWFDPDKEKQGTSYGKWGGFIEGIDQFDPMFFGITPLEAEYMDPQERLFLETAWNTLENAGYTKESLSREQVGVFVGVMYEEYQLLGAEEAIKGHAIAPNPLPAYIANRVSYYFNFHGPSISLDTMCSSSLTSIHLACQSLQQGECGLAIAGGVNISLHPNKYIFLSRGKFLSSDGRCRSFGEGGDGYVPGEGVGAVLLKPLEKARADGDYIYGVILGTSINHCGKTNGFTVPSPVVQADLILSSLNKAQISPDTISYIEAHGTGTSLGDPIEMTGLTKVFSGSERSSKCAIGSVKSNIGHLESAAGIAALTKVILQMQHQRLVPSLHSEVLNPNINWKQVPFQVQQKISDWQRPIVNEQEYPRRAGVSSFGAGGSNAHLIIEEAQEYSDTSTLNFPFYLICLSAKTTAALNKKIKELSAFLIKREQDLISDKEALLRISYTLQIGRNHFRYRCVFIAKSLSELMSSLETVLAGNKAENYFDNLEQTETSTDSGDEYLVKALNSVAIPEVCGQNLHALGTLYVQQAPINWSRLYDGHLVRKIPLPGYPFDNKSYWIEQVERTNDFVTKQIHPLRDFELSELSSGHFQMELNSEQFFLRDHLVNGSVILPGAAYLEIVRAATHKEQKKHPFVLKDVLWLRPVEVSDAPKMIHLKIESSDQNNESKFIVFVIEQNEELVCCEGIIQNDSDLTEQDIDLSAIKNRCTSSVDKFEVYRQLKNLGFGYGPSFQVTQHVYSNDSEVLAELDLPIEMKGSAKDFVLHPSLLDGALRAAFGLYYQNKEPSILRIPFSLRQLVVYQPVNNHCFAYGVRSSEDRTNSWDIKITDLNGKILATLQGFVLREPRKTTAQPDENEWLLYQPLWIEEDLPSTSPFLNTLLLFAREECPKEFMTRYADHVILIRPGEQYRKISSSEYVIRPDNQEDYRSFVADYSRYNNFPGDIIHLWNMNEVSEIEDDFRYGLYSLCCLFRVMDRLLNPPEHVNVLFAFSSKKVHSRPAHEAISGFVRALKISKPSWSTRLLQINSPVDSLMQWEDTLKSEWNAGVDGADLEVRVTEGKRYVRRLGVINKDDFTETPSPLLRKGGVYVVTGGMGGIGFAFAKYLAEHYQARLVLMGRRALDNRVQQALDALKKHHAEALYLSGDVRNEHDVKRLIQDTKKYYGGINGIFHAAGVFHETSFFDSTSKEFQEAIAIKTLGTIYLDRATQYDALDLFVVFSSISSELGDFGVCSYSAGNCFMDNFIQNRDLQVHAGFRNGKSLSIGWPYWNDGGMQLSQENTTVYSDYAGLEMISTQQGLKLFENVLHQSYPYVVAALGNRKRIEKILGIAPSVVAAQNAPSLSSSPLNISVNNSVEMYLKKIVSSITKISVNEIDSNTALEDYGIDSVMILSFNKQLNKDFKSLRNTLLFEYRTLKSLAEYLIKEHFDTLNTIPGLVTDIQEYHADLDTLEPEPKREESTGTQSIVQDIAVIGLHGRFPQAENLERFWNNLKNGTDCIEEIPAWRWNYSPFYNERKGIPGTTYSKWGGFIQDADKFDARFFNISAREAEHMDPQERLLLESAWSTLENAGYTPDTLQNNYLGQMGVFVGVMWNEYQQFHDEHDASSALFGSNNSALANRISYFLNLNGPSFVVDTACSSSLVAIHLACQSISHGQCQLALAAGVNLSLSPQKYITLSQLGMLSESGRCRSYGDKGDGYVPGEGVGSVLLKPLDKALADGDVIHAVIRGSSINHGGKTNGYTVPNPDAQAQVISDALKNARVDVRSIGYVEGHGTGTALGDPIEITGLIKAFGPDIENQTCALGSVKSNIGHLEGAAGIAAFIKVVLQLKYRQLVPSLHSEILNPHIDFSVTPFRVQQKSESWIPKNGYPLRAGVSSFGAGGTNAHIVLEEAPKIEERRHIAKPAWIITLSGKTQEALDKRIEDLRNWLEDYGNNSSLEDLSFTLNKGRTHFDYRCAMVCESIGELQNRLEQWHLNHTLDDVFLGIKSKKSQDTQGKSAEIESLMQNLDLSLPEIRYLNVLHMLANYYVMGFDLDWDRLHEGESHRRISLPVYPFAAERFWLHINESLPSISQSSELTQKHESSRLISGKDSVVHFLRQAIADETKINLAQIDVQAHFEEFGLDSLMIARLNDQLTSLFPKIPATLFFKYHTIQELSDFLLSHYEEAIRTHFGLPDSLNESGEQSTDTINSKSIGEKNERMDIAVIGLSGQFPMADTLVDYWENMLSGRNCISEIPGERWDYRRYFEQIGDKSDITPGKIYCKWGGFIHDVDKFDAPFFNISPREAIFMDPQERLLMQCTWSCIESAGYTPDTLTSHLNYSSVPERVGVFVGVSFNNYQLLGAEATPDGFAPIVTSQLFSLANRISYYFNFTGPSIPIDTACSSSLFAVHLACESIRRGECSIALVGGTNLSLHPSKYATLCSGGFLANDGICHAFGDGGDGYVPSEGVAAVLLKPLEAARADGDCIYGVIRGSAVSHDGKTHGYTVPNPGSQSMAIEMAIRESGVNPRTISYIEAHGTGTALGDPIEITGLKDAFEQFTSERQFCAIGSVKSIIGHTEATAGLAQLVKVLLQFTNKKMVPTLLHGRPLNPRIDFAETPFYVQQESAYWPQPIIDHVNYPRIAGISSFGAGGTNVHVILEEHQYTNQNKPGPFSAVIPLSAKNDNSLRREVTALRDFLKNYLKHNPITGRPITLPDFAYTLQKGRNSFEHRLAWIAQDMMEVIDTLELIINSQSLESIPGVYYGITESNRAHPEESQNTDNSPNTFAQLWVRGNKVNWDALYEQSAPSRIYLPTHSFEKIRYWVTPESSEPISSTKSTQSVSVVAPESNTPQALDFLLALTELPEQEQLNKMIGYCQGKVGKLLGFEQQLPDQNKGFFELGMESLMAITLQRDLEKQLGIHIPDTAMFDYPNIRTMSAFLLGLIPFSSLHSLQNESVQETCSDQKNNKHEVPDELVVPDDIESMTTNQVMTTLNDLLNAIDKDGE